MKRSSRRPVKRAGTSDERVHLNLHKAIIDHRIAPGTPLQEDALAQAFGVSRTVIRKALQRLAHERLVELVPNKGAFVAKPSAEEARQVFDARRALERVLVERAVEAGGDKDIAALIDTARQEKKAADKGDKEERLKLSGAFHCQLARIGGNEVLTEILTDLVSRTSLIIALYESPGAVPCSHGEHLEIATAIRQRNRGRAVQYMNHHLQHIEAQLDLSNALVNVDFNRLFRNEAQPD
ncbi:GntR family transcriptional regulator [Aestuariivirga sp.]|uniref:GntR family transcriptional regulator n=1 Tax=Aestuariivirga sp. TaxID=2650926 RepID=UPI003BAA7F53